MRYFPGVDCRRYGCVDRRAPAVVVIASEIADFISVSVAAEALVALRSLSRGPTASLDHRPT